jgi:hypothetical protein
MSTAFGFCPTCGTPRTTADQRFCGVCGSAFAPGAQAAPPIQPVAPPAPPPPQQWMASVPPPYLGAAQPGVPAPAARSTLGPQLLVLGVIVLAAIVGVFLFTSMNSTSSKSPSPSQASGAAGISIVPSSFSCSANTSVTSTIRLPSSLKGTDQLTLQLDGKTQSTGTVADLFTQQTDGSWLLTSTDPASTACQDSNGQQLSMGRHSLSVLDPSGKVLAEGSYTLTR